MSHSRRAHTHRYCMCELVFRYLFSPSQEDHVISYLPLSHVAGLMLDVVAAVVSGNTVWFAQPDALKGSIVTTLNEVRPTIFLGVPRVWEKFRDKVVVSTSGTTGFKGYLLSKSRVCSASIQPWSAFALLPCFFLFFLSLSNFSHFSRSYLLSSYHDIPIFLSPSLIISLHLLHSVSLYRTRSKNLWPFVQ